VHANCEFLAQLHARIKLGRFFLANLNEVLRPVVKFKLSAIALSLAVRRESLSLYAWRLIVTLRAHHAGSFVIQAHVGLEVGR